MEHVDWHMNQLCLYCPLTFGTFSYARHLRSPKSLRPHTMPKVSTLTGFTCDSYCRRSGWRRATLSPGIKSRLFCYTRGPCRAPFSFSTSCIQSRVFMSTSCFVTSLIVDPRLRSYLTLSTPSSLLFLFPFPVSLAFSYSSSLHAMSFQDCSITVFGHRY